MHFQKEIIQTENQQEMLTLYNSLQQIDPTDIYGTFHPIAEYIFFSQVHKTFPGCTK